MGKKLIGCVFQKSLAKTFNRLLSRAIFLTELTPLLKRLQRQYDESNRRAAPARFFKSFKTRSSPTSPQRCCRHPVPDCVQLYSLEYTLQQASTAQSARNETGQMCIRLGGQIRGDGERSFFGYPRSERHDDAHHCAIAASAPHAVEHGVDLAPVLTRH